MPSYKDSKIMIQMPANKPLISVVGARKMGDEELRLWLNNFIAEHDHLTTLDLSRSHNIGVPRTILEAYIEGRYFLSEAAGGLGASPDRTDVEQKIRDYRECVEGTDRHDYQDSFLETRSWKQFQHACKTAIEENVIVVVWAKPGVGKSRCMLEFGASNLRAKPIEILCSANISSRY